MGRARLVLREKVIDEDGNITEFAIWEVLGRRRGAGQLRYEVPVVSFRIVIVIQHGRGPLIPPDECQSVEGIEEPYAFVDVDGLLADFAADVQRVTGGTKWPRR